MSAHEQAQTLRSRITFCSLALGPAIATGPRSQTEAVLLSEVRSPLDSACGVRQSSASQRARPCLPAQASPWHHCCCLLLFTWGLLFVSSDTTNHEAPGPFQAQPANRVDQALPRSITKTPKTRFGLCITVEVTGFTQGSWT